VVQIVLGCLGQNFSGSIHGVLKPDRSVLG